jgi:hypothetical protein
MERPGDRALVVCFLILSFALALGCVALRNIYDDEHTSLTYVRLSVTQIVREANLADVHPPGMYLLAHFAFAAIPSPRWMTLIVVLLLYAGLGCFAFSLTPLLLTLRERVCFLALATLHPQLLLWGVTIRWYGWWTPLALATLVYALQPRVQRQSAQFGYARALVLGSALAALFYISYVTLVFALALAVALLFRYGPRPWKQYGVVVLCFAFLVWPQLGAFREVHMARSALQRSTPLVSLARLVQGTFSSEAYLPWDPMAVAAAVGFSALLALGLRRFVGKVRAGSLAQVLLRCDGGLASIVAFALSFGLLVAVSGLGAKPRNALILAPALAPLFALVVGSLRWVKLQSGVIVFVLLWEAIAMEHILGRHGLMKANRNDRPEEVIHLIQQTLAAHPPPGCSVLVTYDPLLTLTAEQSTIPNLLIEAPAETTLALRRPAFSTNGCIGIDIFWVRSSLGGFGAGGTALTERMTESKTAIEEPLSTHRLGFDPDAARKRRWTRFGDTTELADFRYVVESARIRVDQLPAVLGQLRGFRSASE